MKVRIVIDTVEVSGGITSKLRSEVWSGDLEILRDKEYLTRISILGHGEPQPICQIPFAIGIGHYLWIPPDNYPESESDFGALDVGPET